MDNRNIDEIVFAFQAGDEKSGEEILRRYGCHPNDPKMSLYIGKYYNMLRYGKMELKDKDTRRFLALFMPDPDLREEMIPFYQYRDTQRKARKALQMAMDYIKDIDDEDFKQDLRMLLLKQAYRYEKKKKSVDFSGYLYNSYRFALYHYINRIAKCTDPYLAIPHKIVSLDNEVEVGKGDEVKVKEYDFEPLIIMDDKDDELGNSWVRGYTCGEEFKDLTRLQRMILKSHHENGITDGELADMMGLHINTVFRQRKKAGEIVKETVERLIEEGYYE